MIIIKKGDLENQDQNLRWDKGKLVCSAKENMGQEIMIKLVINNTYGSHGKICMGKINSWPTSVCQKE